MKQQLTRNDLEDLARGAAFLGAGGGGDPYLGRLLAERAVAAHGPVPLIDVDDLADDSMVFPVAFMGAPTVMLEKLISGTEIELALSALERHLGRKADAVISGEIGGANSLIPVMVAAVRGLPLVDGDGMGRAFPELPMTTFNLHGVACTPMTVANEHGEYTVIHARNARAAEAVARQLAMHMGGSVAMSCYVMSGAQARHAVVRSTISLAREIGRAITAGRRAGDPFESLARCLRASTYYHHYHALFEGRIVDLLRETRQGFAMGRVIVDGPSGSGTRLEIDFQNEYLVARLDGEVRVTVPDLICILDQDTAEPITTETLRYGQRVRVVAVSAAPALRTPEALQLFGPQAFHQEAPFGAVEELNAPTPDSDKTSARGH